MRQTEDDRGQSFWDIFDFLPGQVNISVTHPFMIRGFHLHKAKQDNVMVIKGRFKLVLIKPKHLPEEVKSNSTEVDSIEEVILNEGDRYVIDPGIWHGYLNVSFENATMIYHETNKSGTESNDDYCLPYDFYRWNRGFRLNSDGYLRCGQTDRFLHRIVLEDKLGRSLKDNEVVHHIDGKKTNNDPSNLEVLDRAEHGRVHLKPKIKLSRSDFEAIAKEVGGYNRLAKYLGVAVSTVYAQKKRYSL